jgi:Immunoglobulin-like domain of bacterial spore germination
VATVIVVALGLISWVLVAREHASPTTTTTSSSTTLPATPSSAIWPVGPSRWTSPVAAARAFAVQFLGMPVATTSAYRAGDSRSGEVDVRTSPHGAVTTVLVREMSSASTWSVLGTVGQDLAIARPAPLTVLRSPLVVAGRSTAFEGVANVELRADGASTPVATAVVHGGSMGVVGPFTTTLRFAAPSARAGSLILFARSAKDGSVVVATVVRVWF